MYVYIYIYVYISQYGGNPLAGNSDVSLQNSSDIFLLSYSGRTESFHRALFM